MYDFISHRSRYLTERLGGKVVAVVRVVAADAVVTMVVVVATWDGSDGR